MKKRHAHSLIEMLVVLIIVGVLIAIAIPAVQRARESTRQAQCVHNQGQLAKAVHMHISEEPYGRFPGYRAFAADGTTVIGWAPQLFANLGRNDLPADPTQATFVELLVCPSDQGPTNTPRLSYVVNGGQPGTDNPADGIFFDHAKPLGERVYITKDEFRDGLSNTIMLAENIDATNWNVTDEANQCILWPLTAGNEVNNGVGARPSSHHPGGFVATFADGSVKFMAESVINGDAAVHTDQSIYVALLTPGGNDTTGGAGGGSGTGDESSSDCTYIPGLHAEYWQDTVFLHPNGIPFKGGPPDLVRVDASLTDPAGEMNGFTEVAPGYPFPGTWGPNDNDGDGVWDGSIAAVWTGQIYIPADGDYTFYGRHDASVWIEIDGTEVYQRVWQLHGAGDAFLTNAVGATSVTLTEGWHDLEVRFDDWAWVRLYMEVRWSSSAFAQQAIPEDNFRHCP